MDQEGSSWNPDIVVKQEVIVENDEQPSDSEYYNYLSENEGHAPYEPPQFSVTSTDSEETMEADSPFGRELENSSDDSQNFVPAFKQIKKLAAYSSKTDPDDPWHCTMCSQQYKSEKIMIKHIGRHVENLENSTCCLVCMVGFASKQELDQHRQMHHGQHNKTAKKRRLTSVFVCKICGDDFTSSSDLREHNREVHGEFQTVATLDCPGCGIVCTKTINYSAHVRKHEPFKLCKYFCETCRMPLLKGDVERHRHRHKDGRMSAVKGNVLWRTREESPDLDGSDTQSIPEDLAPTEDEQQQAAGKKREEGKEPDFEKDLPSFAVMKTNAPALAIVKEEVIIDDTEFEDEVW